MTDLTDDEREILELLDTGDAAFDAIWINSDHYFKPYQLSEVLSSLKARNLITIIGKYDDDWIYSITDSGREWVTEDASQ